MTKPAPKKPATDLTKLLRAATTVMATRPVPKKS